MREELVIDGMLTGPDVGSLGTPAMIANKIVNA
jgi:hypothetical protein